MTIIANPAPPLPGVPMDRDGYTTPPGCNDYGCPTATSTCRHYCPTPTATPTYSPQPLPSQTTPVVTVSPTPPLTRLPKTGSSQVGNLLLIGVVLLALGIAVAVVMWPRRSRRRRV